MAERISYSIDIKRAEGEGMRPPTRLPHWLKRPRPDQYQLSVATGEGMIDKRGSRPKTVDQVKRGNQGGRPAQKG